MKYSPIKIPKIHIQRFSVGQDFSDQYIYMNITNIDYGYHALDAIIKR